MTTLKFNALNGAPKDAGSNPVIPTIQSASAPLDIIVKQPEVCRAIGCKKTRLYDLIDKGEFPKPIRLGSRSVGWLMSDVQKYIAARVAESRSNA